MPDALHPTVPAHGHHVEALPRTNRQEGTHFAGLDECIRERVQRQVGEVVAVVCEKYLFVLQKPGYRTEPAANVRGRPGIDEGDPLVLDVAAQQLQVASPVLEHEVV